MKAGLPVEPVWIRGEYTWGIDRLSYFLVGEQFLVRQATIEADGDDWYGCKDGASFKRVDVVGFANGDRLTGTKTGGRRSSRRLPNLRRSMPDRVDRPMAKSRDSR